MKNWQIFLLGLIILEIVADIFVKYYSLGNKFYFAVLGLLCYIIANASWIYSMKLHSNLSVGANIFSVSTGILATLIGMGLFGEVITIKQSIGISLGIVSLILLF